MSDDKANWKEKLIYRARAMRLEGLPCRAIARQLGISASTAARWTRIEAPVLARAQRHFQFKEVA